MKREPEFFAWMEDPSSGSGLLDARSRKRCSIASFVFHALVLALMLAGPIAQWLWNESPVPSDVRVRFYTPGAEGPGGGGGGGGSGGRRPTAYIPTRMVETPPPEPVKPRQAPVAPRKPRSLRFDELEVPDLPAETALMFEGVFSPDATEFPGLSLADGLDYGGFDLEPSSGTGGGIGGGSGTGVGTGEGWGVGPGRGGGFGGGDYAPGGWDIDPVPVFQPPDPPYPPVAREKMVSGEVILQVLVKLDGSTEIIRVVKSLPYCVEAAKENAKLWRWKPALKNGKPVEAYGIITVTFDIFAQGHSKS